MELQIAATDARIRGWRCAVVTVDSGPIEPAAKRFQRRDSLGNSDLRSAGVLSNLTTAWALAACVETSSS